MIDNKLKNTIVDLLENVSYWDTCPDEYKTIIKDIIKELSKVENLSLGGVVKRYSITYNKYGSNEVLTEIAEGKDSDEAIGKLLKKHNYGIEWRTVSHPL